MELTNFYLPKSLGQLKIGMTQSRALPQAWRRQTDAEDTDADGIPYGVMDSAACTRRYKDLLETLRINDLHNGQIYEKIKKSVSGP